MHLVVVAACCTWSPLSTPLLKWGACAQLGGECPHRLRQLVPKLITRSKSENTSASAVLLIFLRFEAPARQTHCHIMGKKAKKEAKKLAAAARVATPRLNESSSTNADKKYVVGKSPCICVMSMVDNTDLRLCRSRLRHHVHVRSICKHQVSR